MMKSHSAVYAIAASLLAVHASAGIVKRQTPDPTPLNETGTSDNVLRRNWWAHALDDIN